MITSSIASRGRPALRHRAGREGQGRDRRAPAAAGRPWAARHQGRHVDPRHEHRHPGGPARRVPRDPRRPVGAERRHGRRPVPPLGRARRRHRRRHHGLGQGAGRHLHHGDRFVLVRLDSYVGRLEASQRARRNVGEEVAMRAEFARVVAGLLSTVPADHTLALRADEERRLTEAANLVTLARTGVDYDFRGDIIDAHAPEMPTRFVKQLFQLMRGATALGLSVDRAFQMALRVCRDCAPPTRLRVLLDVADAPGHEGGRVRPPARAPPADHPAPLRHPPGARAARAGRDRGRAGETVAHHQPLHAGPHREADEPRPPRAAPDPARKSE